MATYPAFSIKGFFNNISLPIFSMGEDSNGDEFRDDIEDEHSSKYEDFIITDMEEYENLIIVRDSLDKYTIENIPPPLNIKRVKVDEDKPYIMIYHTHATEGYKPFKTDAYHTEDNNMNVTSVGETMTKVLEGRSHSVAHTKVHHDRPSYNKSYSLK